MKKYILLFVISSGFSISHAWAQSPAKGKEQTATVNTDSLRSSGSNERGTISKAGKGQQSVYTPPANSPAPTSGTPASTLKEQPAIIQPKKQD